MADNSKIEWTDATWNPVTGCTHVSEGCRNCYAERVSKRFGREFEKVQIHTDRLDQPLKWRKPRKIFVCSMSDLLHEDVPDKFIAEVFGKMARSPKHTFQILTKRPERMRKFFNRVKDWEGWYTHNGTPPDSFGGNGIIMGYGKWPLPNVWLGVSVEDQKTADEWIPILLQTPAAVRWVSYEPALGPADFAMALEQFQSHDPMLNRNPPPIDWIVAGGESGPGARPMHPDWARSVLDQCQVAGVPFFFKQWGEWAPNCLCPTKKPHKTIERPSPGSRGVMFRCGKKKAGSELDGLEWKEFTGKREKVNGR